MQQSLWMVNTLLYTIPKVNGTAIAGFFAFALIFFVIGIVLLIWGQRDTLRRQRLGQKPGFWALRAQHAGRTAIPAALSLLLMGLGFFYFPILQQLWVLGIIMGCGLILAILTTSIPIQGELTLLPLYLLHLSKSKKIDKRVEMAAIVLHQVGINIFWGTSYFFAYLLGMKIAGR